MNFKCCCKSHVVAVNPWASSPFSLFCVDSWQVWQDHRAFLIYGIRSVSSETPHRSLFSEREKIRLNRTGNAVMKEWKYFHYQSICMSTADREWCETFPQGLPKIFPCAIDRLAEPRLNEQCHDAFCIKKCDIQALYLVNIFYFFICSFFLILVTFIILLSTALLSQALISWGKILSCPALYNIQIYLL